MNNLLSPIAEMFGAISNAIIWGIIIFGAIQVSQIVIIATRAYYGLKIIKQVSVLLREIIKDVAEIKRELRK